MSVTVLLLATPTTSKKNVNGGGSFIYATAVGNAFLER